MTSMEVKESTFLNNKAKMGTTGFKIDEAHFQILDDKDLDDNYGKISSIAAYTIKKVPDGPDSDYNIQISSSPKITFDSCTFDTSN
jgi:hypothetical protein